MRAFYNTIILAVTSSVIATVLGTAAAVGINKYKKGFMRSSVMAVTNIPMMNPEIVTGISMMLLFVFVGRLVNSEAVLGFGTLLIAHVTFGLPYIILTVLPKLRQRIKPCGGGAGSRLPTRSGVLQGRTAIDNARHHHRHDNGFHALAR